MDEAHEKSPPPKLDADVVAPRDDVHVARSPLRCPFCHEGVATEEPDWVACAGCLARHHAPCWREGARCGACGHETALVGRLEVESSASPPRPRRLLLVTLVGAFLALFLVGLGTAAYQQRRAAQAERSRALQERRQQEVAAKARALQGRLAPRVHAVGLLYGVEDGRGNFVVLQSDTVGGPPIRALFGFGWLLEGIVGGEVTFASLDGTTTHSSRSNLRQVVVHVASRDVRTSPVPSPERMAEALRLLRETRPEQVDIEQVLALLTG